VSLTKPISLALFAATVAGLVAHQIFGTPLLWAIAFALPAGALALLAALLSGMADANWEAVPSPITGRPDLHASSLAIRLSEAADDPHRFRTRVLPRLHRLALATLRSRPDTADLTSFDDPRAKHALGDELYALLTDEDARMPAPQRLCELLDRLERA
jgi:hypothetical protein